MRPPDILRFGWNYHEIFICCIYDGCGRVRRDGAGGCLYRDNVTVQK